MPRVTKNKSRPSKKWPANILTQRLRPNKVTVGIILIALIAIGVFIFSALAGVTPWEVEQWSKSGTNVEQISDGSASNNSYIRFGQTSPSPTPTQNPAANNCSTTPPAGYSRLDMCDDFNTFDTSRWSPNWFTPRNTYYSNAINDNDNNCYDNRNVSVSGGQLLLTTSQNFSSYCTLKNCTKIAPYAGSIISSLNKYNVKYGYIEARIWMDGENNKIYNWPTFWTNGYHSVSWPDRGEIDIAEVSSDHEANNHYHFGPPGSDQYSGFGDNHPLSPTPGWHVYAVKWEPGKITWIYDGNVVDTLASSTGVTSYDQYILFDNKMRIRLPSDTSLHYLDASSRGGDYLVGKLMKVDYVRVWK